MKNMFRLMTVAALLAGGFTYAADAAAAPKDAASPGDKAEQAQAARRKARADAAALTPEERQARRKEMAAKRAAKLKELNEKKAAGPLTEKEQQQLARLEKAGQPPAGGHRPAHPKKDENTAK